MKLWLVRHAAPLIGKGICYGSLDVEAHGLATQTCAESLARVLPPNLPVQVSGLLRARQLARALSGMRGDLRFEIDTRLNEMDFGEWEGIRWNDIPAPDIDAWVEDFASHRFGGKESTMDVLHRVSQALRDAALQGEAVWLTHAGVIRCVDFLQRHGETAIPQAQSWPVKAPGFGEWKLVELNWA